MMSMTTCRSQVPTLISAPLQLSRKVRYRSLNKLNIDQVKTSQQTVKPKEESKVKANFMKDSEDEFDLDDGLNIDIEEDGHDDLFSMDQFKKPQGGAG